MDIFSFPTFFPRSQPSIIPKDLFETDGPYDYLDRLKEREERLDAKRKAICNEGKDDTDNNDAVADVNRDVYPAADDDDEDEDMDMVSTSSYSINEASEGQEDDVDDEIPFDDSEIEEVAQPQEEQVQVAVEVDIEDPPNAGNPVEVADDDEQPGQVDDPDSNDDG